MLAHRSNTAGTAPYIIYGITYNFESSSDTACNQGTAVAKYANKQTVRLLVLIKGMSLT